MGSTEAWSQTWIASAHEFLITPLTLFDIALSDWQLHSASESSARTNPLRSWPALSDYSSAFVDWQSGCILIQDLRICPLSWLFSYSRVNCPLNTTLICRWAMFFQPVDWDWHGCLSFFWIEFHRSCYSNSNRDHREYCQLCEHVVSSSGSYSADCYPVSRQTALAWRFCPSKQCQYSSHYLFSALDSTQACQTYWASFLCLDSAAALFDMLDPRGPWRGFQGRVW